MKMIVLGILLAVMQAARPIPRHISNETSKRGQKQPNNKETSTLSPSLSPDIVRPKTQDTGADTPRSPSPQQPIAISKIPPVSVEKDWMDKTAWLFGGLLFLVGVAGVCAAVKTLKTINRQADLMEGQRIAMQGQLTAMQGQLTEIQKQATEMEKQTGHLEGSVAAAQTSADAAKRSADIAARVSVPTLVIEKFEHAETAANLADMLRSPRVNIVIKNYGQTPALLKFWTIIFACGDLPAIPAYWNHPGSGIILERTAVETNESYTLPDVPNWRTDEFSVEDVQAIIDHKKTLWAYGFICYDDIFSSARRRLKFCEFALNIREGWIQWERDICPPIYQGIEEFPWGLAPNEGKKTENPNEAEGPN